MSRAEAWATWGYYKKPVWRKIRDLFDDTCRDRVDPLKTYRLQKSINKKQKQLYKEEKNYIPAKTIEDYITIPTENADVIIPEIVKPVVECLPVVIAPPVPVFLPRTALIRRNIDISYPFPRLIRKEFKIVIPRIKINKGNLRKIGWLTVIAASIVCTLCISILFYRGIALMDGDYIGEGYKYKMEKFEKDITNSLEARVIAVEESQKKVVALEDARLFREITHTPPQRQKTYTVRDAATGKVLRIEVK